jgi:hypothetical protein
LAINGFCDQRAVDAATGENITLGGYEINAGQERSTSTG